MSASQTLDLIEKLTQAHIPKETATDLLEFVEKKQTDLVTKDHFEARMDAFEARMATTDAKIDKLDMKIITVKDELNAKIDKLDMKIVGVKNELDAKIVSVKNELNARITGMMLFLGFNTSLLIAMAIKVFLGK